MSEVISNDKMIISFKDCNLCAEKNKDCNGDCIKAAINYLDQEIETNFEHYKKEFIEYVKKMNFQEWYEMDSCDNDMMFVFFRKKSIGKRGCSLVLEWLKQEYRP